MAARTCMADIVQDNSLVDKLGVSELLCFGCVRRIGRVIGLPSNGEVWEGLARADESAILGDS